jgi:hypothetical protein
MMKNLVTITLIGVLVVAGMFALISYGKADRLQQARDKREIACGRDKTSPACRGYSELYHVERVRHDY